MPPSHALQIERMVKRVDNAIHNPSVDSRAVKEALTEMKAVTQPFQADYDHWIRLAIEANNDKKIYALFKITYINRLSYTHTSLNALFEHSPQNIPVYVKSRLFNPNQKSVDTLICYHLVEAHKHPGILSSILLFFKQPKSVSILMRLIETHNLTKKEQALYIDANPIMRRRKHLRKVLLRFWLLTTKPLLRDWREALYVPGTGALYKKALASFTEQ